MDVLKCTTLAIHPHTTLIIYNKAHTLVLALADASQRREKTPKNRLCGGKTRFGPLKSEALAFHSTSARLSSQSNVEIACLYGSGGERSTHLLQSLDWCDSVRRDIRYILQFDRVQKHLIGSMKSSLIRRSL